MEKIGKKIAAGVAYNTVARILIVLVQGITSILLARILSSSDYGIITFAAIFISFLSQFSDFGLGNALVQRTEISQSVLNTAFTMRNLVAFLLVLVALIISFIVPHFYTYPHIEWVIRLMALNFVLNSMGFVSVALLKREMNFLNTNVAIFIGTLVGSSVSVAMAYAGYGFWSLVCSNVLTSFVYVIAIKRLKPCKLSYEFNKIAAHEMWRFGSYMFVSGLMVYVIFNGANFVIGAVQGATALGHFSLALDWGTKIPTMLGLTVVSVLFPAFSKIRDNERLLVNTYIDTVKYVAFVSILVNGTLICISEDFLRIVLGNGTDKWMPALNAFRILCLYGIARAILEPIGSLITALGETKVLMKAVMISALAQIVLLYPVLMHFGVEGISWLILLSYLLQYIIYLPFLKRRVGISQLIFGKAVFAPVICSITFISTQYFTKEMTLSSSLIVTLSKSLVYVVSYVMLFCMVTKFKIFYDLKSIVKK